MTGVVVNDLSPLFGLEELSLLDMAGVELNDKEQLLKLPALHDLIVSADSFESFDDMLPSIIVHAR
jgi:hypothetical protein